MCLKELVIANSHTANGRRPDHAVVIIYITILRKCFLDGLDNILLCDRSAHYLQYPFAFYKSKSICLDGSVMYDYCESFFFFFSMKENRNRYKEHKETKNTRTSYTYIHHVHTCVCVFCIYKLYAYMYASGSYIYFCIYVYKKKKLCESILYILEHPSGIKICI